MTAYKRSAKPDLERKDPRAQLQSASGKRAGNQVAPLLDEEDMADEREMRRTQNRLKRRDYEQLAEDDKADDLFDNPLDRYEQIVHEVPSMYEDDGARYDFSVALLNFT